MIQMNFDPSDEDCLSVTYLLLRNDALLFVVVFAATVLYWGAFFKKFTFDFFYPRLYGGIRYSKLPFNRVGNSMDTTDRDSAENIYKSLTDDRKPPNRIEQLNTPTMRIFRQFDADDYPAGVEMRRKVARNSLQRALEYYRVENRRIQKVVDELRYKTYSPAWRKKLIYGEAAEFSLFAKNQKTNDDRKESHNQILTTKRYLHNELNTANILSKSLYSLKNAHISSIQEKTSLRSRLDMELNILKEKSASLRMSAHASSPEEHVTTTGY